MKIGILSFFKTTSIFVLVSLFNFYTNIMRNDNSVYLILLLFWLVLILGLGQIFHFKEKELVVWYFNPFKKSTSIPYNSITNIEIFFGVSSIGINVFHFKTPTGEIIVNDNNFLMYELKKIKKYFATKNIECEI